MRHSVLALAVGIIVAVFMVGCSGEDNFAASGVDMGRAGAQAANDGAVGTAFAPPTQVEIDFCQIINVNSDCSEVLEVGLLTTDTFDATLVVPTTVIFAQASAIDAITEDWEGDGDIDMVLSFNVSDMVLQDANGNYYSSISMTGSNGKQFIATHEIEVIDDPTCVDPCGPDDPGDDECTDVYIDIKPGSNPNPISSKKNGVVPVAILTTDTFDATQVDPETVIFAGASPVRWSLEDVLVSPEYPDGPASGPDGDIDLLLFFNAQDLQLSNGDETASLTAMTFDGEEICGEDTVKLLGTWSCVPKCSTWWDKCKKWSKSWKSHKGGCNTGHKNGWGKSHKSKSHKTGPWSKWSKRHKGCR